jgi:hypothetical protein
VTLRRLRSARTLTFVLGTQECPGDPRENDATAAWVEGQHVPLAFTPSEIASRAIESATLPGKVR